ncbi:MAG: winged helix-turn-helix domain-containing protein [Nitrososphaera sp.]
MQNRQKDEMIRDILISTNGGATISKIMFRAYASYLQAKGYLRILIENELVEFDSLERKYRTTPKGMDYLSTIQGMSEMLKIPTKRFTKTL